MLDLRFLKLFITPNLCLQIATSAGLIFICIFYLERMILVYNYKFVNNKIAANYYKITLMILQIYYYDHQFFHMFWSESVA